MKISSALRMAALAGLAFAGTAQATDDLIKYGPGQFLEGDTSTLMAWRPGMPGVVPAGTTFSTRAVGAVYDNVTGVFASGHPVFGLGAALGNKRISDDISFIGGPWASLLTGRTISDMNVGLTSNGLTGTIAVRFTFLAPTDFNYGGFTGAGTSMFNPDTNALVVDDFVIFGFGVTNGYVTNFGPIAIPGGGTVVPDGITGMQLVMTIGQFDQGTQTFTASTVGAEIGNFALNTSVFTPAAVIGQSATATAAQCVDSVNVGSSACDYGRDSDYNLDLTGLATAVNAGAGERRVLTYNGSQVLPANSQPATSWWFANQFISFSGDLGNCPIPSAETVALGADGVFVSRNATVASNGVKWYTFIAGNDLTDENGRYIDIDTEGSAANLAVALYDADGLLIAKDFLNGSGDNAQLSFGVGRRAGVGADGRQYDGRNFNGRGLADIRGLAAGQYFLAVAADTGGAAFADCFSVTGAGTAGAATTRFRTNNTGGALAASVAPIATRITSGGTDPLVAPGGQSALADLNAEDVNWYDFQLCLPSSATDTVTIDMAGTTCPNYTIFVFDSSGNLLASQVATAATPATLSFNTSPTLTAGTYYVAVSYSQVAADTAVDVLAAAATAGRWHVRDRRGDSGFDVATAVFVPWASCGGAVCDSIDFNNDTLTPDSGDLDDFIAVLSGGPSACSTFPVPGCNDIDFNNDTFSPDSTDLDAFISRLAGGPCLLP
jgi:hypothetical protein